MLTKETEQVVWESIASAYPHEMYEQDPERFCNWIRETENSNLTDDMIKGILNSCIEN